MNRRIIVVGNLNMDVVAVSKEIPQIGEYIYGTELHYVPGGNGLNQAVVAARLDADAHFIGFVGDDSLGKELKAFIKGERVKVDMLKEVKGAKSGVIIYILVGKEERHIVYPGINMEVSAKDLPDIGVRSDDIVISQLAISQDVIAKAFKEAKSVGATTILNPFPNYDVTKEVWNLSDYIILNEVELAYRSGDKVFANAQHKDLHMDAKTVLNRTKELRSRNDQIIITTLAERGVIGTIGESQTQVNGIKVKFVDATGAGDCFVGAFATALSEGKDFKRCLEFANCAAAISVQKIGTTTSFPKRKEVEDLLSRQG